MATTALAPSDPNYWRKSAGGGMVPYNHPEATSNPFYGRAGAGEDMQVSAGPTPGAPAGTTTAGIRPPSAVLPPSPVATPAPQVPTSSRYGPMRVTTNSPEAVEDQFRKQILRLLGQDVNAASITDPDLAPQAQTFSAAAQQARQQRQAGAAERLAAQGLDTSGALDAEVASSYDDLGRVTAEYNASLVGEKLKARRDDLMAALQIANQRGMQAEANQLSRELANLDAQLRQQGLDITREGQAIQVALANLDASTKTYLANLDADLRRQGYDVQERLAAMDNELRRHGIDTQGNLGQLEIALRRELGIGQLNLGLLNALMGNQQFYDSLGWDMGRWAAEMNRNSIISLL